MAVFGLALLFWAITSTGKHPGARAVAGSIGLVALILALIVHSGEDHHRDREDRWS